MMLLRSRFARASLALRSRFALLSLAGLMVLSPLASSPAHAKLDPELCPFIVTKPSMIEAIAADLMVLHRRDLTPQARLVAWLYSRSILRNVANKCAKANPCTQLVIMREIQEETNRAINRSNYWGGMTVLTGLIGVGIGGAISVGEIWRENPAVAVVLSPLIMQYANILKRSWDEITERPFEEFRNGLTSGTSQEAAENSESLADLARKQRKRLNGLSGVGRDIMMGLQHDTQNFIQLIQGLYSMQTSLALMDAATRARFAHLDVSNKKIAELWAQYLLLVRHAFPGANLADPEIQSYVRPFTTVYRRAIEYHRKDIEAYLEYRESNTETNRRKSNYKYKGSAAEKYYERAMWYLFEAEDELLGPATDDVSDLNNDEAEEILPIRDELKKPD